MSEPTMSGLPFLSQLGALAERGGIVSDTIASLIERAVAEQERWLLDREAERQSWTAQIQKLAGVDFPSYGTGTAVPVTATEAIDQATEQLTNLYGGCDDSANTRNQAFSIGLIALRYLREALADTTERSAADAKRRDLGDALSEAGTLLGLLIQETGVATRTRLLAREAWEQVREAGRLVGIEYLGPLPASPEPGSRYEIQPSSHGEGYWDIYRRSTNTLVSGNIKGREDAAQFIRLFEQQDAPTTVVSRAALNGLTPVDRALRDAGQRLQEYCDRPDQMAPAVIEEAYRNVLDAREAYRQEHLAIDTPVEPSEGDRIDGLLALGLECLYRLADETQTTGMPDSLTSKGTHAIGTARAAYHALRRQLALAQADQERPFETPDEMVQALRATYRREQGDQPSPAIPADSAAHWALLRRLVKDLDDRSGQSTEWWQGYLSCLIEGHDGTAEQ